MANTKRLVHLGEYGKLKVLDVGEPYIAPNGNQYSTSICECVCGNIKTYINSHVRSGHTQSCGCYKIELLIQSRTIHGMSDSSNVEYTAWLRMKSRCYDINNPRYEDYGGRGITVCNRWLYSFENFFADMGYRPIGNYSIDREDNDGNYEPSNCKWSTCKEQNNNRRDNVFLQINGISRTIAQWSYESGTPYYLIQWRHSNNWGDHDSVFGRQRTSK